MRRDSFEVCRTTLAMLASALVLAVPTNALAQEAPELFTVVRVQAHEDMTLEFEGLQKELNAALKEAGVPQRFIYQVVRGPSAEYHIVSSVEKFAAYDEPDVTVKALGEAGWGRWIARVTKCVKSRRVDTYRARLDLSVPLKEGRTPQLAVMSTRLNGPGRYGEYNEWLASRWIPAVKEAGMDGYYVYRNVFGGESREWLTLSFVDSWAAFDEPHPVREHLGQEEWQKLRAGVGEMTGSVERKILRIRGDLNVSP